MPTTIRQDLQLRISLNHIDPPIWRRFVVSNDIKLPKFHEVIQAVMGWEDCHLHLFVKNDSNIGVPDPDFDDSNTMDETMLRVRDLFSNVGDSLVYEYDFGDGWEHQLEVENILVPKQRKSLARCLDGARSCPPEDVGGPFGYADFLEALHNPNHDRHAQYVEWISGPFDSEHFSILEVNNTISNTFQYDA